MRQVLYQEILQEISVQNLDRAKMICDSLLQDNEYDIQVVWYLGAIYLLSGDESEAQMIWLAAFHDVDPDCLDDLFVSVSEVLKEIAIREIRCDRSDSAWLIRRHLQEICPNDIENLVQVLILSLENQKEVGEFLEDNPLFLNLREKKYNLSNLELNLILDAVFNYAQSPNDLALLVSSVAHSLHEREQLLLFAQFVAQQCSEIGYEHHRNQLAAQLLEIVLEVVTDISEYWNALAINSHKAGNYQRCIEAARKGYEFSKNSVSRLCLNRIELLGLLSTGGRWLESLESFRNLGELLEEIVDEKPQGINRFKVRQILSTCFLLPYFQDKPRIVRNLQNQFVDFCTRSLQHSSKEYYEKYQLLIQEHQRINCDESENQGRRLRVGYVCHSIRQHSVAWLARWIFLYHDREKFEIHLFSINNLEYQDYIQRQYREWCENFHCLGSDTYEITEKIVEHDVDILIDMDSITMDTTYEVMALNPAPIQATWLGWDAMGMDPIDYFISDPYVLPEGAQEYYREKLWTLPMTYIAVDGFEVGTPTLSRQDMDIPDTSIIFLTAQRGYKRHQDTVLLQLKILVRVPNSYLLIKGFADDQAIQNFFYEIADEVGVDRDRLRFLESDPSEAVHRANLRIADVVLDTYPYNGATTTMETLWMEVPIVTRVGEQFAARNSYTMMMNAGITEGIAWSAEEYVEWGIRLGTDARLRQEVCWKLRESKKTAPLWNAKQFTRQMEEAYQQMWKTYVDSLKTSTIAILCD
jgi:predicted O-linked N-acetylglucosamine transferase (SPINDLY family)